ncbi:MAG: DsbA family oxidoreductase [Paucibacter sp.]|nr:DsbA family oxidoreductase [Roseateles sp.]
MKLTIDVGFDLVCPWCLIGQRELGRALVEFRERYPGVAVAQRWHSLQLLPGIPDEGLPFHPFYVQRLGSAAAVSARQAQVRQAGRRAGLDFDFASMTVMPNTAGAHALLAQARVEQGEGAVQSLIEALFEAHFFGGANLGDPDTLACIAREHGIEPSEQAALSPYPLPGSGVPVFVFNGREVLSGAQPAQVLLEAMEASVC